MAFGSIDSAIVPDSSTSVPPGLTTRRSPANDRAVSGGVR